jgi:hypothetical protein
MIFGDLVSKVRGQGISGAQFLGRTALIREHGWCDAAPAGA